MTDNIYHIPGQETGSEFRAPENAEHPKASEASRTHVDREFYSHPDVNADIGAAMQEASNVALSAADYSVSPSQEVRAHEAYVHAIAHETEAPATPTPEVLRYRDQAEQVAEITNAGQAVERVRSMYELAG